jgi:two-component system sensor histidine kinase/response regulator
MDGYPMPGAELPATDPAALDRLKRFGGGKLLGEMIALFLAAAPERIAAARTASTGGDAAAAELALHSLKSSSAQLGAMRMQRLSEEGEHRARGGSLDGLSQLTDELEEELERVREWLTRARDEDTV